MARRTRQPGERAGGALAAMLEAEKSRWVLWCPVLFGFGIAAYFALPREPDLVTALAPVPAALAMKAVLRRGTLAVALAGVLLWTSLGLAAGKLRTEWVRAPVLAHRTGPVTVTGWLERVEPKGAEGWRLTLRTIAIEGVSEDRKPVRLRMRLRKGAIGMPVGSAVRLRAILRPPPMPVLPGGYDFARRAWFERLGAVGFLIGAPEPLTGAPPPPPDLVLRAMVERLRARVGKRIAAVLDGEAGAVAAALITGARGRISEDVLDALRGAGLAHVLAISGLHMALMAGALYWLLRAALASIPALALAWPIRKLAALAALLGGAVYLLLSGASVATQRAFIMLALMFLALMLDRPAVTARNVALAALVILALGPESLLNIGFQMSFAAVVALIAVYEVMTSRREARAWQRAEAGRPEHHLASLLPRRLITGAGGILLTTLVASVAVAPFAAYHFHKLSQYGLLANLAGVPIMALLVMPLALASLIAMPFGFEALPLQAMGLAIEALLAVARGVAGLEGSLVRLAAIPTASLAAMVLGGLWLCLWRQRWRLLGVVAIALGLALAPFRPRPDLLIGPGGRPVALRLPSGSLAVMPGRGGNYALARWLEADGDGRDVKSVRAAARVRRGRRTGHGGRTGRGGHARHTGSGGRGESGFRCEPLGCTGQLQDLTLAVSRNPAGGRDDCDASDIVVMTYVWGRPCPHARLLVDANALGLGGVHAVYLQGGAIRVETVAGARGRRPWTGLGPKSGAGSGPKSRSKSGAGSGPGS